MGYEFLGDLMLLRRFLDIIVDEDFDYNKEGLFFSCAARKKYAAEEELAEYKFNKANMFERHLIYGNNREEIINKYINKIKSLECKNDVYLCKTTNKPFREEHIVVYANITPVSFVKSYLSLKDKMNSWDREFITASLNGKSIQNPLDYMKRLDTIALIEYSKVENSSTKRYFDIDIDFAEGFNDYNAIITLFNTYLQSYSLDKEGNVHYILTQGGLHILISVKGIIQKLLISPDKFLEYFVRDYFIDKIAKEVKINYNSIIPLPGTYQGRNRDLVVLK